MRRFRWVSASEVVLAFGLALASTVSFAPALAGEEASGWSAVVEAARPASTSRSGDIGLLKAMLDRDDHIAALEAVQFALDEVGDGATYVWHRKSGPLRGAIKPTASFRDAKGQVCRHILLSLSLGTHTRHVEGIACRGTERRWSLAG
jgi:surface antigen